MAKTPGLNLPFGIDPVNPVPVDSNYGPYSSLASAKSSIPQALRYDGMTVQITGSGEYHWLQADLTDGGLVAKQPAGTGNAYDSFGVTIDGQGSVITTGIYGTYVAPWNGTITGWDLFEITNTPISSSIVIDVWKDTYANYPPTVTGTIWGTKPALSSAIKNTASGLTISITQGDVFRFNVDSVTSAKAVQLILFVTKS